MLSKSGMLRNALPGTKACSNAVCRRLSSLDYERHVQPPSVVTATNDKTFLNNFKYYTNGHDTLISRLSHATGFGEPKRSLSTAKQVLAANRSFLYFTLTNDHDRRTEGNHDKVVLWDRSLQLDPWTSRRMRYLGPPGLYEDEFRRKKNFCLWSEELATMHGDRGLRYSLPCATGDAAGEVTKGSVLNYTEYRQLLAAEGTKHLTVDVRSDTSWWIVRTLRGKNRVIAFGGGMGSPRTYDQVDVDNLMPGKSLLLRFLDPPLMQKTTHLHAPVAARFEVRVFGLIQWQPLRVWVSRHGFSRSGSPWFNYSTENGFAHVGPEKLMWELSAAPNPECSVLPTRGERPPWLSETRYKHCRKSRKKKTDAGFVTASPPDCCICMSIADILDEEHSERGFSTGGTLLKVEHVARQNGLREEDLWRSADAAIVRYVMQQQRAFIAEANGSSISRWQTPFNVDLAFSEDGRAWLFDTHLLPTWKNPGHWYHPKLDRGNALGVYSSVLLANAHQLMDTEAVDKLHRPLLDGLTNDQGSEALLLEFLRDQAFASMLGFRRAWPTPNPEVARRFASRDDLAFARLTARGGLLLPSLSHRFAGRMRARSGPDGRSADLLEDDGRMWKFGDVLYSTKVREDRRVPCEHSSLILDEWKSAASSSE